MAITPIRRVPDELPYARLYLDDIEEITKILLDAYGADERAKRAERERERAELVREMKISEQEKSHILALGDREERAIPIQ